MERESKAAAVAVTIGGIVAEHTEDFSYIWLTCNIRTYMCLCIFVKNNFVCKCSTYGITSLKESTACYVWFVGFVLINIYIN